MCHFWHVDHVNFQKWSETVSLSHVSLPYVLWRRSGVHFLNISAFKGAPKLVCFAHFDFDMCFAPQRRVPIHPSLSRCFGVAKVMFLKPAGCILQTGTLRQTGKGSVSKPGSSILQEARRKKLGSKKKKQGAKARCKSKVQKQEARSEQARRRRSRRQEKESRKQPARTSHKDSLVWWHQPFSDVGRLQFGASFLLVLKAKLGTSRRKPKNPRRAAFCS